MDDFVAVYVFHRLADLFHEAGARPFGQHEVFVDHPLEQLAALDSVECAKWITGNSRDSFKSSYNSMKQYSLLP